MKQPKPTIDILTDRFINELSGKDEIDIEEIRRLNLDSLKQKFGNQKDYPNRTARLNFEGSDRYSEIEEELSDLLGDESNEVDLWDPIAVRNHLDIYVESQEGAKRKLAINFVNYMKHDIRQCTLLLGPSGCGKTYSAEKLADCVQDDDIPFVRISLSNVSQEGFKGQNLSEKLEPLLGTEKGILFLDEIDKTESDVQDNLLDILEDFEFTIRELNQRVQAKIKPVIVITSNAKRELSDPFLRRCYCHHIAFPNRDQMKEIVKLHYPDTTPELMESAVSIFYDLRERGFEKPPATSELLNWVGALEATGQIPNPSKPPLTGVLLKRASDIQSYRGDDSGQKRYM